MGASWDDIDRLPSGATRRFGSLALLGEGALAVADSGVVATYHRDIGVVEYRSDGKARVLAPPGCEPTAMRYAGDALHWACDGQRLRSHDGEVEAAPLCRSRVAAFSPDARWLACIEYGEVDTLVLTSLASEQSTRTELVDRVGELVVADDGTAFLSDQQTTLLAIAGGKVRWRVKGEHRNLAHDPAHARVVAWNEQASAFAFLSAATGKRIAERRTKFDVIGPPHVTDDGHAWLVASVTPTPAVLLLDGARQRVRASWALSPYPRGIALSPSGRLAAVLDDLHVVLVDVGDPKLPPRRRETSSEPVVGLASSPTGDRMAVARQDSTLQLYDVAEGIELAHGTGPRAILRGLPMAWSPDGKQLAIANAYGHLQVLDAATLAPVCTVAGDDSIPATWLFWGRAGIVAVYLGNPADDEQYRGGVITIATGTCRPKRTIRHRNLVGVLDADASAVIVGLTGDDWTMQGAAASVKRIDLGRGSISDAPKSKRDATRAAESAADRGETAPPLVSTDGSTELVLEERDSGWLAICRDARSHREHHRHALPPTVAPEPTLATGGQWFAVPQGPTLVVYPCGDTR